MRKIEALVPKKLSKALLSIVDDIGVFDSRVELVRSDGKEKHLMVLTVEESKVDAVIKAINGFVTKKSEKCVIKLWKVEIPFVQIEEKEKSSSVPLEELEAEMFTSSHVGITYLLLILLSAVLAALGFMLDSAIVVIGAMIIAPLLKPIITASVGTVTGDLILFLRGMTALFIGLGVAAISVFCLGFILPFIGPTPLVMAISQLNPLTIGVAFVSGMVAGVSMISELSSKLAGVSIAVALMPPSAAVGINAFAWLSGNAPLELLSSVILVLLVNCVAIDLGSTLVFYFSGRFKGKSDLFSTHLGIAFVLFVLLSAPFAVAAFGSFVEGQKEEKARQLFEERANQLAGFVQSFSIIQDPLEITVIIISPVDPPDGFRSSLQAPLNEIFEENPKLDLTYVKSESV